MSRPSGMKALLAVAAIVALIAVPAYATYRQVTEDASGKAYATAYKLVEATQQGVKIDRSQRRDGTITREGGGTTAYQCARLVGGSGGWVCVGLSADGRSGAALWFAPKPNLEGAQFLIGSEDALTNPES